MWWSYSVHRMAYHNVFYLYYTAQVIIMYRTKLLVAENVATQKYCSRKNIDGLVALYSKSARIKIVDG